MTTTLSTGRSNRLRAALIALAMVAVGIGLGAALFGGNAASSSAGDSRDAHLWRQLTAAVPPAPASLKSMSDHRLLTLPSGVTVGLHFDNMRVEKAKNLNWIAIAVPGKFTKADQERVNRKYGPGFTHFHDMKADTHGGQPGVKGAWFLHVGARDFTSPFGEVKTGQVDNRFMPTKPKS